MLYVWILRCIEGIFSDVVVDLLIFDHFLVRRDKVDEVAKNCQTRLHCCDIPWLIEASLYLWDSSCKARRRTYTIFTIIAFLPVSHCVEFLKFNIYCLSHSHSDCCAITFHAWLVAWESRPPWVREHWEWRLKPFHLDNHKELQRPCNGFPGRWE